MTPTAAGPADPAAPPRPATATVAVVLQIALVGTLLMMIAVAVAEAIRYDTLIDRAARTVSGSAGEAAFERSSNLFGALALSVPALVLAVWLGVAAVGLRRGSNVARILSLVGLGAPLLLGVLACLFGSVAGVLVLGVLVGASDDFAAEDGPLPAEEVAEWDGSAFYDELTRLDTGGWSIAFGVAGMTTATLALLLGVATGVLLLTSPSGRYFRPRPETPAYAPLVPWPGPQPYPHAPAYWYAAPPPYPPPGPPPGYVPPPPFGPMPGSGPPPVVGPTPGSEPPPASGPAPRFGPPPG